MSTSVLIVTLPPFKGGVPTKASILAQFLRRRGHQVTIAYYATLSDHPDLVIPSWQLLNGKSPSISTGTCFTDFPSIAVGCYLPELEFTYYLPSDRWRQVLSKFDRHIAVGGTVLVSNLLADIAKPFLVWCASTMIDDRFHRRAAMPIARRLIDTVLIGPVQRILEKRVLGGRTQFMTVSNYTRDSLIAAGGDQVNFSTVPVPVDTRTFSPPQVVPTGIIGFAGRTDDPRKNIPLLLRAMRILLQRGESLSLTLTGSPTSEISSEIQRLGIANHITWTGWLGDQGLADFYKNIDVFVFPSGKEGLGIAGIEAMASGVPVVSTRCGGPEDYVIDGKTGRLVNDDPEDMADAIAGICSDRAERDRMGRNARAHIEEFYGMQRFEETMSALWHKTWGDTL